MASFYQLVLSSSSLVVQLGVMRQPSISVEGSLPLEVCVRVCVCHGWFLRPLLLLPTDGWPDGTLARYSKSVYQRDGSSLLSHTSPFVARRRAGCSAYLGCHAGSLASSFRLACAPASCLHKKLRTWEGQHREGTRYDVKESAGNKTPGDKTPGDRTQIDWASSAGSP